MVVAVFVAFASYAAEQSVDYNRSALIVLWLALFGPLVWLWFGGDLNEWSLHPYYRDRLRSAFAVDPARCPPEDPRENPLEQLPDKPALVICAAANLADSRVTALGRPVVSWTFGKHYIGSEALAEVPAGPGTGLEVGYFGANDLPPHLKHLAWAWTAVAVSGAAFSPAMGKMTRPERFLMVLGNLRLGVWYPNPRWLADDPVWYAKHSPRPWYLVKEALGIHRADDHWLYLTDGGHYENLGLVEALSRGYGEVYCFDAAGDAPDTFGTLADAMRLAREEHGIEITFEPAVMKPDKDGMSITGVAAGTVRWPGRDEPEGWVVVAKLSVPKSASFDIIDLARTLPSFPTHPTADQLYTDQKFEAYRALGDHLGAKAVELGARIRALIPDRSVAEAVRMANAELSPRAVADPSRVVVRFDEPW